MSNRWAHAAANIDKLNLKPLPKREKKAKVTASSSTAKAEDPLVPHVIVKDKDFNDIRSMFHDLLFLAGSARMKKTEAKIVDSMYQRFCGTAKLTPKQRTWLAGQWIKHQEAITTQKKFKEA